MGNRHMQFYRGRAGANWRFYELDRLVGPAAEKRGFSCDEFWTGTVRVAHARAAALPTE